MKPLTHPTLKAWLQQLARRVRAEGARISASETSMLQNNACVAFEVMGLGDWLKVYSLERETAKEWCEYAAQILDAGAGGSESGAGGLGLPSSLLQSGSDGRRRV